MTNNELEFYWSLVFHTTKSINPSDYAYDKQNPITIILLFMKKMGNPSDEILFKLLNTCYAIYDKRLKSYSLCVLA